MAGQSAEAQPVSMGVDALIERLRDEGVSAGRSKADGIVGEARAEAKRIVDDATAEAKQMLETAHRESDSYRAAGEQALKSAMRDANLEMRSTLMERFSSDVKRLVSNHLADHDVLKQVILEVTGQARDSAALGDEDALEVILPEKIVGIEELRNDPEELQEGQLTGYVLGLTGEMLRKGVTLTASDDLEAGIRIHVPDRDITLDLSDEAVAELLLRHLQPRFRAVLEGIVR